MTDWDCYAWLPSAAPGCKCRRRRSPVYLIEADTAAQARRKFVEQHLDLTVFNISASKSKTLIGERQNEQEQDFS